MAFKVINDFTAFEAAIYCAYSGKHIEDLVEAGLVSFDFSWDEEEVSKKMPKARRFVRDKNIVSINIGVYIGLDRFEPSAIYVDCSGSMVYDKQSVIKWARELKNESMQVFGFDHTRVDSDLTTFQGCGTDVEIACNHAKKNGYKRIYIITDGYISNIKPLDDIDIMVVIVDSTRNPQEFPEKSGINWTHFSDWKVLVEREQAKI